VRSLWPELWEAAGLYRPPTGPGSFGASAFCYHRRRGRPEEVRHVLFEGSRGGGGRGVDHVAPGTLTTAVLLNLRRARERAR
jgi:hypothetical protein